MWIQKRKRMARERVGPSGNETNKNQGKELYLIFIDTEKTFDIVDRNKLMKLSKYIGIDSKVVKAVQKYSKIYIRRRYIGMDRKQLGSKARMFDVPNLI